MYSIIIRGNIDSDDVEISENSNEKFQEKIEKLMSSLEISDQYLHTRLLNCTRNIKPHLEGYCPRIFDSWSCFNETPPDAVQLTSCPEFPALKFATKRFAFKYCDVNGMWWIHPFSNRSWSNYTNCVDWDDLNFRVTINQISVTGLSISILFLLIATSIFSLCSSLWCGRVRIHNNLCVSLLASNLSWVVWHYAVLAEHQVWSANSVWCRVTHVVTTYFTMTNYAWMLCEGAFLHFLLVLPFLEEEILIKHLWRFGWLCPLLFVLPYAIYRAIYENYHCWMDQGDSNWFLGIPVIIIIILNIYFLARVLIIQRAKLNDYTVSQDTFGSEVTAKQTRAAMFLIPILGINFLLLPIRPAGGSSFEYFYDIVSTIFSSFQGVLVSCLLCFLNGQVRPIIKSKLLSIFSTSHQRTNVEMTQR